MTCSSSVAVVVISPGATVADHEDVKVELTAGSELTGTEEVAWDSELAGTEEVDWGSEDAELEAGSETDDWTEVALSD